jgi:hypothetical protein
VPGRAKEKLITKEEKPWPWGGGEGLQRQKRLKRRDDSLPWLFCFGILRRDVVVPHNPGSLGLALQLSLALAERGG